MAAIEPIDIVELGVGDAQAGLALSTEAGWNQNVERPRAWQMDWTGRPLRRRAMARWRAANSSCRGASVVRPLAVAHGGHSRLSPPRHCDEARRCLPRRGSKAWFHDLAGRDTRWRRRLRAARLQADAAIETVAANEAARHRDVSAAIGRQSRRIGRLRRQGYGIRPQFLARGVRRAGGLPHRIRFPGNSPRPQWTRRATHRPAAR